MKQQVMTSAAAIAAAMTMAGLARAQYRTGNDGRALDANNRIGSGGLNDAVPSGGPQAPNNLLGNAIVTGNVTGGRQFRGFVPYSDPNEFSAPTASSRLDRFVRESSGAPYGGVQQNNAQVVQPFYSSTISTAPPAGFSQQGTNGAFVPTPTVTQQPADQRLGNTLDVPTAPSLPQPGQVILPGPVDPNTQTGSVITASPLYGTRSWSLQDQSDAPFLNGAGGTTGRRNNFDPATLAQLRSELTEGPEQNDSLNSAQQQANPAAINGQQAQPFERPQNQSLSGAQILKGQPIGGQPPQPTANNLSTGASLTQRRLMGPERQSTQYSELQKRLKEYQTVQAIQTASEQNTTIRPQNQPQNNQQNPNRLPGQNQNPAASNQPENTNARPQGGPATPSPAIATPKATPKPDQKAEDKNQENNETRTQPTGIAPRSGNKPPPLQIKSLAEGVKAKGLADLLRDAEEQTKNHHYNSALEQYEMADQVAPNNPLILLGRANAELGQSYYTRAEAHLRQAFMQDQALLMGQYDLRSLLGNDRLEYLVADLKQIADREQKEARPLFLLAYIAYDTGNERRAAAYLDLAEKRAGKNDPLYPLLRQYWSLPQDQSPAPDMNK